MKFRQGTKWCGSSFLSKSFLPLFYLRKTKHWSLLHSQGFFSVNMFCCYCFCVLYFLLFLFTSIFFSFPQSLSFYFVARILVLLKARQLLKGEHWVWPISWFLELRQPIKRAGFPFSFSAGFPHCCYVPASSLTSSAKLCVEASVNPFRCGNANSRVRKCTYNSHKEKSTARGDKMIVFL